MKKQIIFFYLKKKNKIDSRELFLELNKKKHQLDLIRKQFLLFLSYKKNYLNEFNKICKDSGVKSQILVNFNKFKATLDYITCQQKEICVQYENDIENFFLRWKELKKEKRIWDLMYKKRNLKLNSKKKRLEEKNIDDYIGLMFVNRNIKNNVFNQ